VTLMSVPTVSKRMFVRLPSAALLGAAAVVLVSCGGSGKGLIPEANAGPLQSDFEAVAQAAQTGNGNCAQTTAAINKTERDFAALPTSVDSALHDRLSQGISNLRERALALCAQPLVPTTTTTTPRTTTTTTHTQTTPAPAETTPTTTTTTTHESTTPASPTKPPANNGGGTAAPGAGSESGASGGTGAGESEGAGGESGGAGGQEGAAK
jgi:cytoskeletal protein RodZ